MASSSTHNFVYKGNKRVQIGNGMIMGSKKPKPKVKEAKEAKEEEDQLPSAEVAEIKKKIRSNPSRLITEKELRCIAKKCNKRWKSFMRYLDFEDDQIDRVHHDTGGRIPEAVYQLLLQWWHTSGDKATVSVMLSVLEKADMLYICTCLKNDAL